MSHPCGYINLTYQVRDRHCYSGVQIYRWCCLSLLVQTSHGFITLFCHHIHFWIACEILSVIVECFWRPESVRYPGRVISLKLKRGLCAVARLEPATSWQRGECLAIGRARKHLLSIRTPHGRTACGDVGSIVRIWVPLRTKATLSIISVSFVLVVFPPCLLVPLVTMVFQA